MEYKRNIHPLANRLKSIWLILTSKEYILIKIKRTEKGRIISNTFRTNKGVDDAYADAAYAAAAYKESVWIFVESIKKK